MTARPTPPSLDSDTVPAAVRPLTYDTRKTCSLSRADRGRGEKSDAGTDPVGHATDQDMSKWRSRREPTT